MTRPAQGVRTPRAREPQCPLCREALGGSGDPQILCAGCQTAYHQACAEEMGGCATLGCARRRPPRRERPPARGDFLARWDRAEAPQEPREAEQDPIRDPLEVEREAGLHQTFDGLHFSCALVLGAVLGGSLWARGGFEPGLGWILGGGILVLAIAAGFLQDKFWGRLRNPIWRRRPQRFQPPPRRRSPWWD